MELACATPLLHQAGPGVQLWCVDLDRYAASVALEGFSLAEQSAAARKAFAHDRSRYLACRHALRRLLGKSLGLAPADVPIHADVFGKPMVTGARRIEFNVSHSEHLGLIGLSDELPIGVDIETQRTIVEADSLARFHFTDDERSECIRGGSFDHAAFLSCWTRKEAGLKALGIGLAAEPAALQAGCGSHMCRTSLESATDRCEVTVFPVFAPPTAQAAVALALPGDVATARRCFLPR